MNTWFKEFNPIEKQVSPDLESVANSLEWFIYGISGLTAMALFIVAAKRSNDGDTFGSFLAAIGAVVSATAPIISKTFFIG